ncbi:exosome complex exonuclease Rrp41 [archaeon]|nr:exosome complex exonuclease Rrp41 [archaeon]
MQQGGGAEGQAAEEWRRPDGRAADELRPLRLEVGVLENAEGSAYGEQGRGKILVAVYGPTEVHPRHMEHVDRLTMLCRYHMAPFSTEERRRPQPTRRDIELSKVIREALEAAVLTERFPRSMLKIFIEVLEAAGGTRCLGITLASLALANAGIPMRDLVVGCAAGKYKGRIVLDLSEEEDKEGEADMAVAIMPSLNRIVLLQMDGELTREEFFQALDLAIEGCRRIHKMQVEAIKRKLQEGLALTPPTEEKE